jgi:hypothetical protein
VVGADTVTRRGRPTNQPEVPSEAAYELMLLAREDRPMQIDTWLQAHVDKRIDAELEFLASHVLSLDFEVPGEIRGVGSRGGSYLDDAFQLLISRMRRRFSKLLRDHQRRDDDHLVDSTEVV